MMLTSLFGELGLARTDERDGVARPAQEGPADRGFAARALIESSSAELGESGRIIDRHVRDLFVAGSPAQAMRDHFAATAAADASTHEITLFDPSQIWARSVIKMLSDASGQSIDRLHLRDHVGLRTLGTIERTAIRRFDETLKIYHADLGPAAQGQHEIPFALMERSEFAAVIMGSMPPSVIDATLDSLRQATAQPTWRCRTLLFMLPPGAIWLANKVSAIRWPPQLHVAVLSDSMNSASAVWNALLGVWNDVKGSPPPPHRDTDADRRPSAAHRPIDTAANRVAGLSGGDQPEVSPSDAAAPARPSLAATAIDKHGAREALAGLLLSDGILGCALLELATNAVVVREQPAGAETDLDAAAAACGPVLRAHRVANRSMGLADRLDELAVWTGNRLQIVRAVPQRPGYVLMALFDTRQINSALARLRVADAAKNLA
jgi:hypothetical protein